MSWLAFLALALSSCGGTQESAREPSEQVGGEVQAERGESGRTPGYDDDAVWDEQCARRNEMRAERGELSPESADSVTPGVDDDVQWENCWIEDSEQGTSPDQGENDMP